MSKIIITVCMGSSCYARGNAANLEFIENYIKDNGLEAVIDLAGARCEGKCVPVLMSLSTVLSILKLMKIN